MSMSGQPLVSIITPSLNQGRFIGATLQSVENQTYPNVEHIIMDGLSTDGSVAIIKAYAGRHPNRVVWVSEKDDGQTDALNKGLQRASGSILAYLNSDDTYEAGAVERVVKHFQSHPELGLVHGRGHHIASDGRFLNIYPSRPCNHTELQQNCYICQPAAFWQRNAFENIGMFDSSLRYAMDYDYWIRLSKKYPMAYIDEHLANARLHDDAKTARHRHRAHREILEVVRKYYGEVSDHWIYSFANSFPWIDNLRTGKPLPTIGYVFAFTLLSGSLFLKYNHRIPLRTVRHFLNAIPQVGRPGRLS